MRFAISHVLDAIERRVSTNPLAVGAVVNLDEIVRLNDLDGGPRPTTLRLGLVIDALGRYLSDSTTSVYPVADRALLSDTELASNERMTIRRWSDDGMVEVLPSGTPLDERVREVSALVGVPVISRDPRYGESRLVPTTAAGGVVLNPVNPNAAVPAAGAAGRVTSRQWRCEEPDCASFGSGAPAIQPPPHLRGSTPTCPRHGGALVDAGARPPATAMIARVGGVVRHRFIVGARPVLVGRSPEGGDTVKLGPYLDDTARRRVSRTHVQLQMRPEGLTVTDLSTNGTAVYARTGRGEPGRRVPLTRNQPYLLGQYETVQLHVGVELGRAGQKWLGASDAPAASVMADAPTIAIRLPRP